MPSTPVDRTKIPLKRVIGLPTAILFVAGMVIGSGVFKKIAPMSATHLSEPYILAAWIIAGIFTMLGAFTLSGFASTTTESGGVYEYLRLSVGNFFSFLYGWSIFTIIGSGAIAALAFIFSQALNTLISIPDPFRKLEGISVGGFIFPFASSGIKLVAVGAICLLTWINYRGTKKGSVLSNVVTTAKLLGITLLIVLGLTYSDPAATHASNESTPFLSGNTAIFSALFGAMLSAFWAYDGWFAISYVTGEIKDPKRNVPWATLAGMSIVMVLYVLLNFAYMQVLPLAQLAGVDENSIAAAVVARFLLGNAGTIVISILIAISTFGALNACILVYPRAYYRMAQEGFFFRHFANVHPAFRTPYVSLVWSMIWAIVLVVTGTFDLLTNLIIFAGFFFYILLALGLIRMKRKGALTARVIGYPATPVIIIVFAIALIVNTVVVQTKQSIIGLFLVLSGVPVYFYFKRKGLDKRIGDTESRI